MLISGCLLFPGVSLGFANKTTGGDCSPIITGNIQAPVRIECGKQAAIPAGALAELEAYLQESYRSQKYLNDMIDKLSSDVADWEQKYKEALAQNAADRKKHPDDPLLEAEQQALQDGALEQAARHREAYYRNLKQEKTAELANEAYAAASRWESAFNMHRALALYQEAVLFKRDFLPAWRSIGSIAKKLGNYSLALEAAQNLQQQLDPENDAWWLAVALSDEGDVRVALGHNLAALKNYRQAQVYFDQLAKAAPENPDIQRDLSVSHNKVGDMHLRNGDNAAALKAYQESLAIRKKLAELDPNVVQWQTDLAVSLVKLAQIDGRAQKTLLNDALAILQQLLNAHRLDHETQGWIGYIEDSLLQISDGDGEAEEQPAQ